jgi:hypothetical protein
MRTIRCLSRASTVGAVQTLLRSVAGAASDAGSSAASYCRKARSAARRAASRSRVSVSRTWSGSSLTTVSAATAAAMAPGPTNARRQEFGGSARRQLRPGGPLQTRQFPLKGETEYWTPVDDGGKRTRFDPLTGHLPCFLFLGTATSLRRRPSLASAPCGAGWATGQGAEARTPQRPSPLHDGTWRLAVRATNAFGVR